MQTTRISLFCFLLLLSSQSYSQDWANQLFSVRSHDFGNVAANSKTEFRFEIYNPFLEEIVIDRIESSCSCTTPILETRSLKTYEKGSILAHFNTDRVVGYKSATITVHISKPFRAIVELNVKGYVRSDIAFYPPSVNFAMIPKGKSKSIDIKATARSRANWKILDILCENQNIRAEIIDTQSTPSGTTITLRVRIDENLPVGYLNERIVIVTNDTNRNEIPLQVEGVVQANLSVSPSTLFLGVVQKNTVVEKQVIVRGDKPFSIVSISNPMPDLHFLQPPASSLPPKSVYILPIRFISSSVGKFSDTVKIKTDIDENPLELILTGEILEK